MYTFTEGEIDWVSEPVQSPGDKISEDKIFVFKDKIELRIPNAAWSSYEPTGSMEPVLSEKANGLYIVPKGPEDIEVGDIIAYSREGHDRDIVHRVMEISQDEHGNYYYITKGDANPVPDPNPIYYKDIQRVLIGIIY